MQIEDEKQCIFCCSTSRDVVVLKKTSDARLKEIRLMQASVLEDSAMVHSAEQAEERKQ